MLLILRTVTRMIGSWRCNSCGSLNNPGTVKCWNCGTLQL